MRIRLEFTFLIILSFTAFWLKAGTAFAGSSSMDEVKSQYSQEMGKDWEGASADEKKEFLNILETRRKANNAQYQKRGKLQELKDMSTQKERTPYNVRKSFENEMGISWEDATEEQQEEFQRGYDLMTKKIEQEQRARDRELKNEERKAKLEKSAEKREMMVRDRQKKLAKKQALEEERRKRAEEKRKLRNSKKKRNALVNELKKKMKRD